MTNRRTPSHHPTAIVDSQMNWSEKRPVVHRSVDSHKEVMQMDPDLGDLTEELALVWQMEKDSQSVPSAHFHFDSGMFKG